MKRAVAVFFGAGLVPVAPGTVGSAAATLLAWIAWSAGGFMLVAGLTILAVIAGFWSISGLELDEDEDPASVVIDEVAGQFIAVLPVGFWLDRIEGNAPGIAAAGWFLSFLLFRVFDIAKPWLVGKADRMGGTAGIMLDDIAAGVMASVILAVSGALALGMA